MRPRTHIDVVPGVTVESSLFDSEYFWAILQEKLRLWAGQKISSSPPSLSLMNLDEYQKCYKKLKDTYARDTAAMWCEKTDPDKFIHEDIGIAAYLICLWKSDSLDVSFVDIGCGNGLLVFLLISEGFRGIGLDIRKRAIWNHYPENVRRNLIEATVDPSSHQGFPDATWLIGNHSDELTPWLPILAARSNPRCCAFAIPCCPFSLFQKFDAGKHSGSDQPSALVSCEEEESFWRGRYRSYVTYLRNVFEACGFVPEVDILRIPSTKRFIDQSSDWENRCQNAESIVRTEGQQLSFNPRERHPSHILKSLSVEERTEIGSTIFRKVLDLATSDGKITTIDGRLWNPGGCLSLQEASKLLDVSLLAKMKQVNGGLQSVLRNQHQTFMVTGEGIRLRFDPSRQVKATNPHDAGKPRKTKPCWFEKNHPDGCPYPSNLCTFAHKCEHIK